MIHIVSSFAFLIWLSGHLVLVARVTLARFIGFVPSANRHVLVALKLVSADTPNRAPTEWWIRTAYPYGRKRLKKKLASGSLQSLRKGN